MKRFMTAALLTLAVTLLRPVTEARGDTIGFDDITTNPYYEPFSGSYHGFDWRPTGSILYAVSDYLNHVSWGNSYDSPSGEYALLNYNGFRVSLLGGGTFDFNGAYVSALSYYDNYYPYYAARTLTVTGYRAGAVVGSVTVSLNAGRYDWLSASLLGIDTLVFTATGGSYGFSYFLMDNFTYNQTPVPEPATALLLGSGLAGGLLLRRRRRGGSG